MIDISQWKKQLERERQEKNRFFRLHPQSPLPIEDRRELGGGLDFFPPDPAYRFELELYEYEHKEDRHPHSHQLVTLSWIPRTE